MSNSIGKTEPQGALRETDATESRGRQRRRSSTPQPRRESASAAAGTSARAPQRPNRTTNDRDVSEVNLPRGGQVPAGRNEDVLEGGAPNPAGGTAANREAGGAPEVHVEDFMGARGPTDAKSGRDQPKPKPFLKRMFPNTTQAVLLGVVAVVVTGLCFAAAGGIMASPVGWVSYLAGAVFLAVALSCGTGTLWAVASRFEAALKQQQTERQNFAGSTDASVQDYDRRDRVLAQPENRTDPRDVAARTVGPDNADRMLARQEEADLDRQNGEHVGYHNPQQPPEDAPPPRVQDTQFGRGRLGSTTNLPQPGRGSAAASGTASPVSALDAPVDGSAGFRRS